MSRRDPERDSVRRLVLCCGLMLLAFAACRGVHSPATAGRGNEQLIRVMTFNIAAGTAGGAGGDSAMLARIARVIRESDADIVALQEVDVHWSARSLFADQADVLARALGMHVRFAPIYHVTAKELGARPREFGVALLSRFPVTGFRNHELLRLSTQNVGAAPSPAPGFLEATVIAHGVEVRVFNTHLDYRGDPAVRIAQVREMLAVIGDATTPTLLFGDLNATPDAPELQPLFRTLHDVWNSDAGAGLTYPAKSPAKRIDFVLGSSHFRARAARVIETDASDHRPVVADVLLFAHH